MNTALLAAVALLAGKAYAAHLPHYDVSASVDTARATIDVTVKVTVAASDLQDFNEFRLGSTYEISAVSASAGAKVEVNHPEDWRARTVTLGCDAAPCQYVEMRLQYHGPLAPTGTRPLT